MRLAICREPYLDELFYGYIRSLAVQNGIFRMQDMEALYLHRGRDNTHVHLLYPTGVSQICDFIENHTFPGIQKVIDMTPYHAAIVGISEGQQAKLSESILYTESPAVPRLLQKDMGKMRYCPECWQEDVLEHGEGYLHLSHHLPGVSVCRRHQRPLLEVPLEPKRHGIVELDGKTGTEIEVADMEQALKHADRMYLLQMNGSNVLQEQVCSVCGRWYLNHPYSVKTDAGCPYCNQNLTSDKIINRRLEKRFGKDAYKVLPFFTGIHTAVVEHIPCGTKKKKLDLLLYGEPEYCMECRKLEPKRLQKRFDPSGEKWLFYENGKSDRLRKRIHVKHKVCGKEWYIFASMFTSKSEGYCPYCDNLKKRSAVQSVDAAYEVVGDYQNNRTKVKIRHKGCGIIFETSKSSFLAGTRCPICVPRYSFEDVVTAVKQCTVGYEVKKGQKRGQVMLRCPDGVMLTNVSYQAIMNDLKATTPALFGNRTCKYKDKISVRKEIFDRVRMITIQKGYWEFADGLAEGVEVTREKRNLVQDMARLGYIKRIGVGKYIVEEDYR